MSNYQEYLQRKKREWGKKFDPSELAQQFVPYFESGQRIIVKMRYGGTKRGYVGVTTGWKPCFLLMHNSRSISSSTILREEDEIVGTVPNKRR